MKNNFMINLQEQMSEELRKILQQYAVGAGNDKRKSIWYTHVSMVQPRGKYAFNNEGFELFWAKYCDVVAHNDNPMIGLAEAPRDYGPVIVDVDIKIEQPDSVDLTEYFYSEDHVMETVQVYQDILRTVVDGCTDDQLTCVLFERPPYRPNPDSNIVKNGFHMQFPNLFLSQAAQRIHIIPRVRDEIKELGTFSNFVEDSGTVIDDVSDKPWLLYGSKKSEAKEPYKLTKIYDYKRDEISLEEAFKHHAIYDLQDELIKTRGNVKYYLPRILSIIQHHRPCSQIKPGIPCPNANKTKACKPKINRPTPDVADDLRIASKLLPMLAEHRATVRDEWMDIGWALFNIGDGCQEALDLWLQHSQRSPKYDETSCIDQWRRMVKKGVTLGTLKYYAEQDNPKLYYEFKKEHIEQHVKKAIKGSHYDVAKILQAEFGNQFICASVNTKIWYQFCDHHWKEIEGGTYLRNKISTFVVTEFSSLGKQFMDTLAETEEQDTSSNKGIDRVQKVIASLKNNTFKNSVMAEATHVFYDERFKDRLDMDPYLVAFTNGVYDLKLNLFRAGRPEDFISKTLPIAYTEFSESDDAVQEIMDLLEKIYPDKSVRTYFLDIYSDIFVGGNSRKIFLIWTGCGNNGKSIMQHMLEDMLGPLAVKLQTTLFSGPKVKAGQANPELIRLAPPCRSATMEEPDGDEALNIGLIKSLTGGDKIGVRDLYQSGKSIKDVKPLFMPTLICNKLPKIRHPDPAFWERVKVIPYETQFIRPGMPCPETYEEQLAEKKFPMDLHFSARIPDLLAPFAWVLLNHRKKPITHFEPDKVREATNRYRRQNDDYRKFIQEKIIEDDKGVLPLDQLFNEFRFWFNDCYPNRRGDVPDRDSVQDYFTTAWGEATFHKNKFEGYRIRTIDDDCVGDSIEVDAEDLIEYDEDGNVIEEM